MFLPRPRPVMALLANRRMNNMAQPQLVQPPMAPVSHYGADDIVYVDDPNFGAVPHPYARNAVANNVATRIDHRNAMYNNAFQGEVAEDWDDDEDEDEFGAEAYDEDDADVEEAAYSGVGRLRKKLSRLNRKEAKWEARSQNARTEWGRKRARRKASKFSKRSNRIEGKLARKTAGASGGAAVVPVPVSGGGGGVDFYMHDDAPPKRGHKAILPLYPIATPTGIYTGSTDQPTIKGVLSADGLGAEIALQSPEIPWATVKVVGLQTSYAGQRDNGGKLYLRDFRAGGSRNLFVSDEWQDGDHYDVRYREAAYGLRDQPVIKSPNRIKIKAALFGDQTDRVDFSVAAIVDVIEDADAPTKGSMYRQSPGSYAS